MVLPAALALLSAAVRHKQNSILRLPGSLVAAEAILSIKLCHEDFVTWPSFCHCMY
jgi:hypothetical protein